MSRTDTKIRPIVWLMGLTPFVAVAAIFVYLLQPDKKPVALRPTALVAASPESQAPVVPAPLPSPTPSPLPQPVAIPSMVAALPSAAPSGSADERAEIDALLARPPGSEQWTVDQKNAYRAQVAHELRSRERKLEWEIAAAHRARDSAKEQAETDTLAYARRMGDVLAAPINPPSSDAGLAD